MLAEDFVDDPQAVEDLQRIHNAGTSLLRLINDLLDIAKIESDRIELAYDTVGVDELVAALVARHKPAAARTANAFEVRLDGEFGALQTDQARLSQILSNLLDNAFKFTSNGIVTLAVAAAVLNDRPAVAFSVQDTGEGLHDDQRASLFRAFSQGDSSPTREFGGTGLGLAIAHSLCTALGGHIAVDSAPGEGSTFTVTLPRQQQA